MILTFEGIAPLDVVETQMGAIALPFMELTSLLTLDAWSSFVLDDRPLYNYITNDFY